MQNEMLLGRMQADLELTQFRSFQMSMSQQILVVWMLTYFPQHTLP